MSPAAHAFGQLHAFIARSLGLAWPHVPPLGVAVLLLLAAPKPPTAVFVKLAAVGAAASVASGLVSARHHWMARRYREALAAGLVNGYEGLDDYAAAPENKSTPEQTPGPAPLSSDEAVKKAAAAAAAAAAVAAAAMAEKEDERPAPPMPPPLPAKAGAAASVPNPDTSGVSKFENVKHEMPSRGSTATTAVGDYQSLEASVFPAQSSPSLYAQVKGSPKQQEEVGISETSGNEVDRASAMRARAAELASAAGNATMAAGAHTARAAAGLQRFAGTVWSRSAALMTAAASSASDAASTVASSAVAASSSAAAAVTPGKPQSMPPLPPQQTLASGRYSGLVKGKSWALITGASSGLGADLARDLSSRGFSVVRFM